MTGLAYPPSGSSPQKCWFFPPVVFLIKPSLSFSSSSVLDLSGPFSFFPQRRDIRSGPLPPVPVRRSLFFLSLGWLLLFFFPLHIYRKRQAPSLLSSPFRKRNFLSPFIPRYSLFLVDSSKKKSAFPSPLASSINDHLFLSLFRYDSPPLFQCCAIFLLPPVDEMVPPFRCA